MFKSSMKLITVSSQMIFLVLISAVLIIVFRQGKEIYYYGTQLPYIIQLNKNTSKIWPEISFLPVRDKCPHPEQPGRWRMVSKNCYVFSAYIDSRPQQRVVRIIGACAVKGRGPDKCHLYFSGDSIPEVMDLEVLMNTESHRRSLTACISTCTIPTHRIEDPCAVELFNRSRSQMGLLPIYRPRPTPKKNFTVCVPSLHSYNNAHQFVETIEANRLFGAEHFYIYHTSISKELSQYLSYYIEINIATVIPWNMPTAVAGGLHYSGQLVSVQDCYYRSRHEYNYVVFLDMDEVIVPRNASSWDEMIRAVPKGNLTQGGYILRSKHFCPIEAAQGLSTEVQQQARNLGIHILLWRTWKRIFRIKIRSKMIVSSESAVNIGIHFIFDYIPGHGEIPVDDAIGVLHHYRLKPLAGMNCTVKTGLDNYMDRFAGNLIGHVKKVDENMKKQV